MIAILVHIFEIILQLVKGTYFNKPKREVKENFDARPEDKVFTSDKEIKIKKDFLTKNRFSRPALQRRGLKGIEIHWVANPKSSAKGNRAWFESRKGGGRAFGSTHFIIDLDGDIIQVIPEIEIAYSSGARKYKDGMQDKLGRIPYYQTISIECTHHDWSGKMSAKTYNSLVLLCTHLCRKYGLMAKDLYLHFDITGKVCHRWFVANPNEWVRFRNKVDTSILGSNSKAA